ncbi:hydroxyacylglutathione hydrolase [Swingsia samuiensis]|uniref:Hydroxyacylglutathione hydrolase n=1 Tax=Swingsia samuiensis TaxID=1293412 RepID=A0A4Y6UHV9_9PROT|nr:hydroxyacylglutathione hydrolase [Swingsia samuiensis]QDH16400.1 hydroxyacylglutathione hydrolase [Swingsia samuiensis]
MAIDIRPVRVLTDNYAWLLTTDDGIRAVVDPGDAEPIMEVLGGEKLNLILLTHHHSDHTMGAEKLKERYGAKIFGPEKNLDLLPPLDRSLGDGESFLLGKHQVDVLLTPGHAVGHISFVIRDVPALFSGDVLFSAGCGRLLEGSAEELFRSLHRYDDLPDETLVCAGHEYTRSNIKFARSVDPDNLDLKRRSEEVEKLLSERKPTLPVTLGEERRTNPFLRALNVDIFAQLRREKDVF